MKNPMTVLFEILRDIDPNYTITPDGNGWHIITALGKKWTITSNNLTEDRLMKAVVFFNAVSLIQTNPNEFIQTRDI